MRTITDIMQNAVSVYLGFPLLVNFGTAENNYTDADEVGAVLWRAWHDVKEKALRMYPWSFCREDGTIVGTKESNPSYKHFTHYATISDFLYDMTDSSATIEQTVGTSLSNLAVNIQLLESKIGTVQDSTLDFIYNGVNWTLSGNVVNIAQYGVSFSGTPVTDDDIQVVYTAPVKIKNYVCMQAVFYDPRHWSKSFEWKQFGKDLIRFNLPKLYVEYTKDVDVDDYPAYFVDYLSCALALECCAPLRVESKLPMLVQQLTAVYLDARKQDSMGEPAPASFDNIIDEARNAL
jgi:hypothetical protein